MKHFARFAAPIRIADPLKTLMPLTQRPQRPSASQRFSLLILAIILTSCALATTTPAPTTVAAQAAETATSTPPSSATPEMTATPPPTLTPEAPAEDAPASCMDTEYIDKHFVQPYLEQSGYPDMPAAMAAFREKNGKGGSAWSHDPSVNYTEDISFSPVMYLGNYKVPFAIPGYSGTARCAVVAYPGTSDTVRVVTVVTDATVNGKWSSLGISDAKNRIYPNIETEKDFDHWLDTHTVGSPVSIFIKSANGPRMNNSMWDKPKYSVMRDLIHAAYPDRFAADRNLMREIAGDLEFPDPYDIFLWLDPKQDVGLIAGIGDPLNK